MMDEASSPTDISSSLSEFIRKERILKELYQENRNCQKPTGIDLKYNDEEIDGILQQMGRLLSPAGEELDNKVYKHVIAETENKSIEQILNEAKELISDSTPLTENASICISTDDLSSECPENDINLKDVKHTKNESDVNGNRDSTCSSDEELQTQFEVKSKLLKTESSRNGHMMKQKHLGSKKEIFNSPKLNANVSTKNSSKNNNKLYEEINYLRDEIVRINRLYKSCKNEGENLKKDIHKLEQKWQHREKQLLEETRRLSENATSTLAERDCEILQSKLNRANEMVDDLKSNFSRATDEWKKKEIKLIDERNQLRYKLQNSPKMLPVDLERLQEQLKDCQEVNVKLKFDLDSYKDKCNALENLCTDLKKVIMDEEIAERVYANDNIPASVKQFLSSSSSSVINTLTQMFGCLSRGASRNRQSYSGQKDVMMRKSDLFTTSESLMINDLTKSFDQSDLIRELIKEKDQIKKENSDLNRQVKELEQIVRRRVHPNFSNVSEIIRSGESKMYEKESETIKNLKKELLEKQHVIIDLKNQLVQIKVGYDQNLLAMQGKLVNIQEENMKLKEEVDKKKIVATGHGPKCKRKGRSCDPPPVATRNFRMELMTKEKEIQHLNKQLDDVKNLNKKLIKAKENYYLSSKEQSSDDIQLNKTYISSVNNEVNEKSNYMENGSMKEQTEVDMANAQFANPKRNYEVQDSMNEKQPLNGNENLFSTRINSKLDATDTSIDSITNNNANDYKQLSERINLLESKNQNLPQFTGDLLALLSKGELGDKLFQNQISDKSEVEHRDELNKFVTAFVVALKNVSNQN